MNRVGIHRWFMEKLVGIDRRKLLPDFAQTTFESWAKGAGLTDKGVGGEVVIFQTCYVQGNEPQIGMDTVEVLEKNGIDVRCERGSSAAACLRGKAATSSCSARRRTRTSID